MGSLSTGIVKFNFFHRHHLDKSVFFVVVFVVFVGDFFYHYSIVHTGTGRKY
jgi:hypothetical protein